MLRFVCTVLVLAVCVDASADTSLTREIQACEEKKRDTKASKQADQRGRVLYSQGDYDGAAAAFVRAYCRDARAVLLYNIAQTFERLLDYDKAVAYFDLYLRESMGMPQENVERRKAKARADILRRLPARISVATSPGGAKLVVSSKRGIVAQGRSNDEPLLVPSGDYELRVELPGHKTVSRTIKPRIGRPYSYYFPLRKHRGTLRITTSPGTARIFIDKKLVGIGRHEARVPVGTYQVTVEAKGRTTEEQTMVVTANKTASARFRLAKIAQSGRTELVIAGSIAASLFGLASFSDTASDARLGSAIAVGGAAIGLAGSYLGVPDGIPKGHTAYIIDAPLWLAADAGLAAFYICENTSETRDCSETALRVGQIAILAGALAASLTAGPFNPKQGDIALVHSGVLWGTLSGVLFGNLFGNDRRVDTLLALTGLNLGLGTGLILANRTDMSRARTAIIDLGGLAGAGTGVALAALLETESDIRTNMTLIGLSTGIALAAYLSRNFDDAAPPPKAEAKTSMVLDAAGTQVPTFGFALKF